MTANAGFVVGQIPTNGAIDSAINPVPSKIYYLKIWQNNVLTYNLVPFYNNGTWVFKNLVNGTMLNVTGSSFEGRNGV
jgi:hypothetical protein